MAHTKRRVFQHIMEDESWAIVGRVLPKEWARHEYTPDYGIDFVVEVFKWVDASERKADTLSELFFVQLKSVEKTEIKKLRVHERHNVAKTFNTPKEHVSESLELDVIPFTIDTSELLTIESMGSAIPVLLFLVTLDTQKVYFVCLNDLIEKVIIPADRGYTEKETKTIHVPIRNEVTADPVSLVPLRFYAKRSKLYGAFAKFAYQNRELHRALDLYNQALAAGAERQQIESCVGHAFALAEHFLRAAARLTIWDGGEMWWPIKDSHERMTGNLADLDSREPLSERLMHEIDETFRRLTNLSNMYEELCREWFLPTLLAQYLSYPGRH